MSNPPRKKGTAWETYLLGPLRELFYPELDHDMEDHPLQRLDMVARHKRAADGDFVGVPFTIEAKSTKTPMFQAWARKLENKVGNGWAIIWKGDRRVKTGAGPYVLMPYELFNLITAYALDQAPLSRDGRVMLGEDVDFILRPSD